MVKNPHTSQYDLEIEYNDSNLEVGTFYSFSWHLMDEDSMLIEIVGQPEK